MLWGLLEDQTLRSVFECLRAVEANIIFVNHADVDRTRVQIDVAADITYGIASDSVCFRLDTLQAAYLRPYDIKYYERATADTTAVHHSDPRFVHQLINTWAEYSPATIINRPSAEGSNHSKLYQALRIADGGFLTPESLVTNARDRALTFLADHRRVIYKSMSSVRSIVRELSAHDLDNADLGPVLLQRLIVGRQIRVHVVGERCFACLIECEDIDYRYAPNRLIACSIPDDVAQRCVTLTRSLGLRLAGLDLIEAPSGDWYCLEVNTNPGFSYYDTTGEGSVAQAVAEVLVT
jgi:glutathione synthase/RimK-type ligase-like ATP-grasp enzyme